MKISEVKQLVGTKRLCDSLGVSRQAIQQYEAKYGDQMPERWRERALTALQIEFLRLRKCSGKLSAYIESLE